MENWFFGLNEPYSAWGEDSGSQLYVIWKVKYGNSNKKLTYKPYWWIKDATKSDNLHLNPNIQRFMYEHEKNWATETMFEILANQGINSVRIPVGYWLFHTNGTNKCKFTPNLNTPPKINYYEIVDGFYAASSTALIDESGTDGVGKLNHIISLCIKYNFKIILDLHASPGVGATSQQFAGVNAFFPYGQNSLEQYKGNSAFWAHIYRYYLDNDEEKNDIYNDNSNKYKLNNNAIPFNFSNSYAYNMNKDTPPGGRNVNLYSWPTDFSLRHNGSNNWGHYTMKTIIPNIKSYIESVNNQYPNTIIGFEPWNEADQFNCPIFGIYAYLKLLGDINFFTGTYMNGVKPIINIIGGQTLQELKMAPTSNNMILNYNLVGKATVMSNIAIGGVNKIFTKSISSENPTPLKGDYILLTELEKILNVEKITFDDHTYIDWTSATHKTSIDNTIDFMCGAFENINNNKSGCIYYGWGPNPHQEQSGACVECGGGCALKNSSEGSNKYDIIHGEWSIAVNNNNTLAGSSGYGPQSIKDLKALYNNMMIQNTISKVTGSYYWNFRAGCTFTWGQNYINNEITENAAWIGVQYPISIGDPLGPSCNGSWSLLQLIQMGVGNNISNYISSDIEKNDYCDSDFGGINKSDKTISFEKSVKESSTFIPVNKRWSSDEYWSPPKIPGGNCKYWGSNDIPNNNINLNCLIKATKSSIIPNLLKKFQ